MKISLLSACVVLIGLLLVGCQPQALDHLAVAETVVVGPEYSASKGLFVPEDSRRALGVMIVAIDEQRVASSLRLSLRIYELAGDVARASGLITPEQAMLLQVGQMLDVQMKDGQSVPAKLTALLGNKKANTGSLEVLAEIPTSTNLAAGTFVTATAVLDAKENVTTVPRSALVQATDGYFVYTVSGQHFVRTPVKLGVLNAEVAQVREGLYSGDEVVSQAAMALWLTELSAVKGGQACCAVPVKGK